METKTPTGILATIRSWLAAGEPMAVATVISTWGSAPVPVGGQMAVRSDGKFAGSVSGGCIEADVIAEAETVLADGRPRTLSFGIKDETAWRAGLACGGKMRVLIERLHPDADIAFVDDLLAAMASRRAVAVSTVIATGRRAVSHDGGTLDVETSAALSDRKSRLTGSGESETFIHVLAPPPRLVIVGGTHMAQALAGFAVQAGFETTVIDPRAAFIDDERFNDVTTLTAWPDEAADALALDPHTAVATLTHVGHIDDDALVLALGAGCRYVGALGSRKTHAGRVERLKTRGISDADIARIKAPVGIDIGAVTPEEIAVSILAEIILAFRGVKPAPGKSAA